MAHKNTFAWYWERCGHPRSERLHAVFVWNTALGAACARIAERSGMNVDTLKMMVEDLRGSFEERGESGAAER